MRTDLRLLLAALLLLPLSAAGNDWMREYERGMRAFDAGDWGEAEARFRAAARLKPEPAERQRFQGTVFRPYLPQHYAALAAWRRGDCEAALGWWQHTGLADVLARIPERAAEAREGQQACRPRTQLAAAPTDAPAAGTTAAAPADAAPAATATATPTRTQPTTQAPSATTASPAPALADARPAATPPPQTRPTATPAAQAPPPVATAAARAEPARPSGAPAALTTAVDAYLAGRYGDLERIDPATAGDDAARAQLLLLRAAARFIRAELEGGDAADAVTADIRAAKAANARLAPDTTMFPPRFRAAWAQAR